MADLRFPYRNTERETIQFLQNRTPISSLTFKFEDDLYYKSRELQEAIIRNKATGMVECLKIRNFCSELETHNKCFDFFLECLQGPSNGTKIFFYCSEKTKYINRQSKLRMNLFEIVTKNSS